MTEEWGEVQQMWDKIIGILFLSEALASAFLMCGAGSVRKNESSCF